MTKEIGEEFDRRTNKMKDKKEFKTLKDIGTLYLAPKDELKAEAIKWVKYYQRKGDQTTDEIDKVHWYGRVAATIEQNNITEEDLK